jgi:hypothetical protein
VSPKTSAVPTLQVDDERVRVRRPSTPVIIR